MPITASAPPRKGTRKTAPASTGNTVTVVIPETPLSAKGQERADGLKGWTQFAGLGCMARGLYADAAAIAIHGETLCTEAARIGENDEKIGKILDYFTMSGPYAALVGAVLPFVVQIGLNHRIFKSVPVGMDGVMPPAALDAQVKAGMAEAAAQAAQIQIEAERKLAEANAMLAAMNGHPQEEN